MINKPHLHYLIMKIYWYINSRALGLISYNVREFYNFCNRERYWDIARNLDYFGEEASSMTERIVQDSILVALTKDMNLNPFDINEEYNKMRFYIRDVNWLVNDK